MSVIVKSNNSQVTVKADTQISISGKLPTTNSLEIQGGNITNILGGLWGSIVGNIIDQTDLQEQFATKQDALDYTPENVDNKSSSYTVSSTTTYANTKALVDGLATKVDKVVGKGLSTEDYTTAEKNKLSGIEAGAEVNVNADWNSSSGDSQILNKPTIPEFAEINYKTQIVISKDNTGDIKYTNSQDFSVVLASAITMANNVAYGQPKLVYIKKGIYYQDTPFDFEFDPTIRIEGVRWETAYLENGTMITWRGTGYVGVAPYQIGFKGNTLIPTGSQTYDGSITKGLQIRNIAFNGGNSTNAVIKTYNNLYFFNQDRIELEYCRFVNSCRAVDFDSDIQDSAFDSSKQPGGVYFNRCNFIAYGDGTSAKYEAIRFIKNTQCWLSNCWFAKSSNLDYWLTFDRTDKVKVINCEFNETKTALFNYQDSVDVPCNNNVISGCALIPDPATGYIVRTNLVNSSSKNLIAGCYSTYNTHPILNEGTETDGVIFAGCGGYVRSSTNNNYLLKYKHGDGEAISGIATTDIGSVGVGKNSKLSMLHIQLPADFSGTGTVSTTSGNTSINGTNTLFTQELAKGDYVVIGGETRTISSITTDTVATITTPSGWTGTNTNVSYTIKKSAFQMETSGGQTYYFISNDGLTGVGTASPSARFMVDGFADNIQLKVQGHSTQTRKIITAEKSNATEVFSVDNDGKIIGNSLTIQDTTDRTKQGQFIASTIATGTTRTYTLPDASGTLALTSDLANYVPYTGATGNVDLGIYNLTTNKLQLNTNPTLGTLTTGQLYWDTTNHTASLTLEDTTVNLQLGQEVQIYVRNNTGSIITNGSVVYQTGVVGGHPTIALALANAESTTYPLAIATQDIPNNSFGYCTTFGKVRDLNTNSFNENDELYLSSTNAGQYTTTPPASPNYVVKIGSVVVKNPANGEISVNIHNPISNNNSLGTSQKLSATQNAIKQYVDTGLSGKQNTLTLGNLTESISSILTITGGTGAVIGNGTTIQVKQASNSQSGFLSSTDWSTFNGKQNALGFTAFNKAGDTISATDGTGMVGLQAQSVAPSTPSSGLKLYADSSNRLSWKGQNGFTRTFDGTSNTADRTYTLPNLTGTIALISQVLALTGGTLTGDLSTNSALVLTRGATAFTNTREEIGVYATGQIDITSRGDVNIAIDSNNNGSNNLNIKGNGNVVVASISDTGAISGSNLSGTNTGDETTATIQSKLNLASANLIRTVATKTASYSLVSTDDFLIFNGTSLIATLPTAVGIAGKQFEITNTNASVLTIATTSSQTISGSTPSLLYQWEVLKVISDGANWIKI